MGQIVLTGFMATGKSVVGRKLARLLDRPFVDTDVLIERAAGRSIPEIFATDGESHFRSLERTAVEQATAVADAVVATGGGTLVDPENRRRLASGGTIICLTADPEVILQRVGDPSRRPVLAGSGPTSSTERLQRIRRLLGERAEAYGAAHHAVDTTGLSIEEVVERVRALVVGQ